MTNGNSRKDRFLYILAVIVLVGGAIFWCSDLISDPPTYFSGSGQSLSTDPAQYIQHARNKVLFGQWNLADHSRWTVFQHSLTSLAGYALFSLFGVSAATANATGVVLSLGGLILILFGLARRHRPWVLAAVAFLYVTNVTLLTHGRLSYLENGLVFITGLMFLVYSRWGDSLRGVAVAGALAAVATFTGKLIGGLLLPALVMTIVISETDRRLRFAVIATLSFVAAGAALVLILYGGDTTAVIAYLREQSHGIQGFPGGLSSPWGFVEHLVSFGYVNRLYYLGPDLLMLLICGASLLIFLRNPNVQRPALPRTTAFCIGWILTGVLGLMVQNYSPIRYSLFLIPAFIVFCLTAFDHYLKQPEPAVKLPGKWGVAVFGLLVWICLFQVIANGFFFHTSQAPIRILTWAVFPAAIGIAWTARYVSGRFSLRLGRRHLVAALAVVLCLSAVSNAFRIRRAHFLDHNFNIVEASEDLDRILGAGAVLSGPYSLVLALGTDFPSMIYLFSGTNVDDTFFERHPVTHLVVDISNWQAAVNLYPGLASLPAITTYWIRDFEVRVFNISRLFGNPQARDYRESHYEKAIGHFQAGRPDSAQIEIDHHLALQPMTKSAGLLVGDLLWERQRYDDVITHMTSLANRYRTDAYVQIECARMLQMIGLMRRDNNLVSQSQGYYDRAVAVNRFKGSHVQEVYNETLRRMTGVRPDPEA